jgi:membrane protein YdbS with pleckstrin-like domain
MAKKSKWRSDEQRVVSVTPVSEGLLVPALVTVVAIALVVLAVMHVHFFHTYRVALSVILVGPGLAVFLTRTLRWRSHKIHLTNQRIVVEGGVLQHTSSEVELRDIVTTHVSQRLRDRVTRRGDVVVETAAGTLHVGVVRHPAALGRLIDNERKNGAPSDVAYNTVFDFDSPQDHDYDVSPRRHRGRRW